MLKIEALSQRPMHATLFDVSTAITDSGGWVTDHKLYSDMLAMIAFEIPQSDIQKLLDALAKAALDVSSYDPGPPVRSEDITGQLVLTFTNTTPTFRRDVPAFG
jgi:hypothetical protein